jgi:hypothetical protein
LWLSKARRLTGDRLADRGSLEESLDVRRDTGHIRQTITFRPVDREILDDRDAHTRHLGLLHHFLEGERVQALPVRSLSPFDPHRDLLG